MRSFYPKLIEPSLSIFSTNFYY